MLILGVRALAKVEVISANTETRTQLEHLYISSSLTVSVSTCASFG